MPGNIRANQIDHILIDKRHATSIIDVRSYRGACCDTDHYLVISKLRQRISKVNDSKGHRKIKWNTQEMHKNEITKKKYRESLETNINNNVNGPNERSEVSIDEHWNELKNLIINTAKDTIGERRSETNEWYDEDCRKANNIKQQARKAYVERCSRANFLEYQNKRKEAKKIIRTKKKIYMKQQIEQIERDFANKNVRSMYQNIKRQTKAFQPRANVCKDKNGNIISDKQQVIERWKQHFTELLNESHSNDNDNNNEREEIHTAEILIEGPSIIEVTTAINKLKNNKTGGEDGIPAELVKYGGQALHKQIHYLVKTIWEKNKIPNEWLTSVIVPIHKKGNKTECRNYRGISLLNVGYKVFTNIVYERIKVYADEIIDEYQCGFRSNRSTIDQGFLVNQIFEKFFEHNIDIFCLFIDFKQAFDSLDRKQIRHCFQKLGVPLKLIELVLCTLKNTTSKVLVQGEMSEPFQVLSGVKQGDALSALIFNLMLHTVVKDINLSGTIFDKDFQICAYADDVLIMAKNKNKLIRIFKLLETKAKIIGLNVNAEKTKFMLRSARNMDDNNLAIDNFVFESVNEFKYLGFVLSASKDTSIAINERIKSANKTYYANIKLFRSKVLSRMQKIKMYKTLIRPVLTYGAEIWTLKVNDVNQLLRFERAIMRKIYGPIRLEDGTYRIRYNHEIENLIGGENVIRFIKAQRIRWIGHIIRMPNERIQKRVFTLRPIGGRKRGRPRKRWLDDVEADLKAMNVRNWRNEARERLNWRRIVDEAMVHHRL